MYIVSIPERFFGEVLLRNTRKLFSLWNRKYIMGVKIDYLEPFHDCKQCRPYQPVWAVSMLLMS